MQNVAHNVVRQALSAFAGPLLKRGCQIRIRFRIWG